MACQVIKVRDLTWLQVGPPYIMHREDMETVAPLWYHFTREVRNDPEVCTFASPAPLQHTAMVCRDAEHADPLWKGASAANLCNLVSVACRPGT